MNVKKFHNEVTRIQETVRMIWPVQFDGKLTWHSEREAVEIETTVNRKNLWQNNLWDSLYQGHTVLNDLTEEGAAWMIGAYVFHISTSIPLLQRGTSDNFAHSFFTDFTTIHCVSFLAKNQLIRGGAFSAAVVQSGSERFRLIVRFVKLILDIDSSFPGEFFSLESETRVKLSENWLEPQGVLGSDDLKS